MSVEDASRSVRAAKQYLTDQWEESGEEGTVSCPSCDTAAYEWEVKDENVRIRCDHCGYEETRRYVD